MALRRTAFSVCTALDGKQIRHLALSLEELWSLENRCAVTLCLLFKAKEQNKLSWGENELTENGRKKPNNLLNNPGVKGLFKPLRSKSPLRCTQKRLRFERLLQGWTIAASGTLPVGEACGHWEVEAPLKQPAVARYQPMTE